MHGAGNDFVMFLARDLPSPSLRTETIVRLCHRRLGIGADGVIILETGEPDVDFRMHYFNSDGHEAEMCGNGARCSFALAHAVGLVGDRGTFASAAGRHQGRMTSEGDVEVQLTSWSGLETSLDLTDLPWADSGFCNTGVPHVVVLLPDRNSLEEIDIMRWGPVLRRHPRFGSSGSNVNWAAVDAESGKVHLRTFERGVEAETLACGTGASAAAVILCGRGLVSSPVRVRTRGGDELVVRVDPDRKELFLQGPAVESFKGEVNLDE